MPGLTLTMSGHTGIKYKSIKQLREHSKDSKVYNLRLF